MPRIPIVINHASIIKSKNMVENLAQPSLDETIEFINLESTIQVALA
jgi:short-subunit dehydrogenase involved in D-alanine esterification of teichoic acids